MGSLITQRKRRFGGQTVYCLLRPAKTCNIANCCCRLTNRNKERFRFLQNHLGLSITYKDLSSIRTRQDFLTGFLTELFRVVGWVAQRAWRLRVVVVLRWQTCLTRECCRARRSCSRTAVHRASTRPNGKYMPGIVHRLTQSIFRPWNHSNDQYKLRISPVTASALSSVVL